MLAHRSQSSRLGRGNLRQRVTAILGVAGSLWFCLQLFLVAFGIAHPPNQRASLKPEPNSVIRDFIGCKSRDREHIEWFRACSIARERRVVARLPIGWRRGIKWGQ
jgi:hypothetical protein